MRRPADPPADDAAGVGVDHEGHVDEARPGRHVGEVGEPQRIRMLCLELPIDVVQRAWRGLVAGRSSHLLAADHALQSKRLHQSCHGTTRHILALTIELPPDLAHAVDTEVLLEHTPNLGLQSVVPLRTC